MCINSASLSGAVATARPPKDLAGAVEHLADQDLERLFGVLPAEQQICGNKHRSQIRHQPSDGSVLPPTL
jgi:hypothetical protein